MDVQIREKIFCFIKEIDKKRIWISMVFSLAIFYYINPFNHVEVSGWDRTFSDALLSGISIEKRITNIYVTYLIILPFVLLLSIFLFTALLKLRRSYVDIFFGFSATFALPIFATYVSRFNQDGEINNSIIIALIISFYGVLIVGAIIDRFEALKFLNFVRFFILIITVIILRNVIFVADKESKFFVVESIIVVAVILLEILLVYWGKEDLLILSNNIQMLLTWIPILLAVIIEIFYFRVERGHLIAHPYRLAMLLVMSILCGITVVSYFFTKHGKRILLLGYVGILSSVGMLYHYVYLYNYQLSFANLSNLYEISNGAVAADTILYHKLPIIDYFSAHALEDVWTRIIYGVIHNDVKGVLANPYASIHIIVGLIILFFIVREFLDSEYAFLFVVLFPGIIQGIHWYSVCLLPVAMALLVYKKVSFRNIILFWSATLLTAFMRYDEGISIGVACIIAMVISFLIHNDYKSLKRFILSGVLVAFVTSAFIIAYSAINSFSILTRVKEWMLAGLLSSSTWATAVIGDITSLAYDVAYVFMPIMTVFLLFVTLFRIIKYKNEENIIGILTIVFLLTQLLYLTRTIVFHNLTWCRGVTGVLYNYVHWSVALFLLYRTVCSYHGQKLIESVKYLFFSTSMMLVILIEGLVSTNNYPMENSIILCNSLTNTVNIDMRERLEVCKSGGERIYYEEETQNLISSFQVIFDLLLTEEQSFIDFANITALYTLTDKVRPAYVSQTPSLLTNVESQDIYLKELNEYDLPLAIMGAEDTAYIQSMVGVKHNVRYYRIAEYLYRNYRPLVNFNEFSIWCQNEDYDSFHSILVQNNIEQYGYCLVDYGYDLTMIDYVDEGNIEYDFAPLHSINLKDLPYIWANYDEESASNNEEKAVLEKEKDNVFVFEGSRTLKGDTGNYLYFECENSLTEDVVTSILLQDTGEEGAIFQYYLNIKPGFNSYLIRVSTDYFWNIYNINCITFASNESVTYSNLRVLVGD